MSDTGSQEPASGASGRIRLVGAVLLLVLAALTWLKAPWADRQQAAWFDAHQTLLPRTPERDGGVTVVAIDQKSLTAMGRWPWPRNLLAQLVERISSAQPAAIGINILMPEPDALSPERLLEQGFVTDPMLMAALRSLPTHDEMLARALAAAPAVLVLAGTPEPTGLPLRAPPITVRSVHAAAGDAPPPEPAVLRHAGALTNLDLLDREAHGWGLISAQSTRGVLRRMPLVASIDGTLVPTLAVEMLRVAERVPSLRLAVSGTDVRGLSIGTRDVPTEADGEVRVYFKRHLHQRFVSAVDVLADGVDLAPLRGRPVLIGITGIGLQEDEDTPIGERVSGSEIHAQLLENLLDGTLLRRPAWAPTLEAGLLIALGTLLLWALPRWRPFELTLLMLAGVVVPVLLGFVAFRSERLLLDAATPGLSLMLLFATLMVLSLAESTRQRRTLQRLVQRQRERGARVAGELQAAQQVQTAMLPRSDLLAADPRVELQATLRPAREVGGDLYDYFMLDERRLFLLIGDVAGKGLSASIFMAVSKALYKSAMLRSPDAAIGTIMAAANAEVSRDNPQHLFVTAFAAVLDLQTGRLDYCNAGHDNPYRLHASRAVADPQGAQGTLLRIEDGDGPPLCAVPDYPYQGGRCQLLPGETLCLITDGVTEAQTEAGALYGNDRLRQRLLRLQQEGAGAHALVEALSADVQAFAAGAEPADDLTILALRWNGPAPASATDDHDRA